MSSIKEPRGWWISPEGEHIAIQDHFKFLLENPEKFGFKKGELTVPWEPKGDNREKYMSIAFQRDWIRVREHKGHTTYQFWQMNESVKKRIKAHLEAFNFFPQDQLNIAEVSTKTNTNTTKEQFINVR